MKINYPLQNRSSVTRIWKGILGIPDLIKMQCRNQENNKYIDGIWDLTASREVGLHKIWARDAGLITLSYRAHSSHRHKKTISFLQKSQNKGPTYILHLLAFVEIRFFNVFFWERKTGFGILMKNVRDAGFL